MKYKEMNKKRNTERTKMLDAEETSDLLVFVASFSVGRRLSLLAFSSSFASLLLNRFSFVSC